MLEKKRWLQSWGFGVVFFLCALFAWQASAQTLIEGMDGTGTRRRVLVDATGKIILSTAAALGLVQVAGGNGTSVATATNPFPVRPSADGTNPVDATHPLMSQITDGVKARIPPWAKADDDDDTNEVVIQAAPAVEYTLPGAGWFDITAVGNSACIICGAAPVAVMNTVCTIRVLEGVTRRLPLTGPKCSVIGPSAAGYVHFLYLNPAL